MESPDLNSGQYVFPDMVLYLDLDYDHLDPKLEAQEQNSSEIDLPENTKLLFTEKSRPNRPENRQRWLNGKMKKFG
ncbi:hypothetical protein G4B88_000611 [Cannabis sativa]|uniref:Uncharacterized protein n=1 Tax=Cannabis sativa TaxID=3483 RepID=A0A7J6DZI4_CANSA|nr:hypothetical protein G4B88_000611 [Cannabis sativa]